MSFIAQHLKGMNRRTVYQLLLAKGELSKAEISRQTGISAPTVIKIIDYFIETGFVEETGEGEALLGRKPQMLSFKSRAGYAIGVEFSGVELKAGIVDFAGNICHIQKTPVVPDFKTVIGGELFVKIEDLINGSGIPRDKIKGLCVGVPAAVNSKQKTIDLAPLVGITELTNYGDIVDELSDRLKMPVFVENDANAAAMGEFINRGLGLTDDLLFIILGKGIGSGIILNGMLRQGNNFSAGEIGYMVFDTDFVVSKRRSGWLEQQLGLDDLRNGKVDVSSEALDIIAGNLALAILNICVPFEIAHVVFGRLRDDKFDAMLVERINKHLRSLSVMDLECQLPRCKEPGIVGCANIVIEPVLDRILKE
jgi:predicted NBD/HSP70 family sugar kinase